MPLWVWEVVNFLQVGVSSNWFGLSCPPHCRGTDLGSLAASFLLGLIVGTVLVAWIGFRFFHPLAPLPVPAQTPPAVPHPWSSPQASAASRPGSGWQGTCMSGGESEVSDLTLRFLRFILQCDSRPCVGRISLLLIPCRPPGRVSRPQVASLSALNASL